MNWVFGGIVEDFPGAEKGWVFYEKMFTVSLSPRFSLMDFSGGFLLSITTMKGLTDDFI